MIVVPSSTVAGQPDKQEIMRIAVSFVVLIALHVPDRIGAPSDVSAQYRDSSGQRKSIFDWAKNYSRLANRKQLTHTVIPISVPFSGLLIERDQDDSLATSLKYKGQNVLSR